MSLSLSSFRTYCFESSKVKQQALSSKPSSSSQPKLWNLLGRPGRREAVGFDSGLVNLTEGQMVGHLAVESTADVDIRSCPLDMELLGGSDAAAAGCPSHRTLALWS